MTTIYVNDEMLGPDADAGDVERFIQILESELPDNTDVRIVRGAGYNDFANPGHASYEQAIAAAHDRAWQRFCGC